MDLERANRDL
jgi:hypothetical protein